MGTERAKISDQLQVDDFKSLHTFIVVAEFVWLLILNYAEVVTALYELKEHHRKWCWEAKHKQALKLIEDTAWNSINNIFSNSAVQMILFTDGSDIVSAFFPNKSYG